MSYILDALKKSETERDREQGGIPDIQSIHNPLIAGVRQSTNVWPYVSIISILVGGIVVVLIWMPSVFMHTPQEAELPDQSMLAQLNGNNLKRAAPSESITDSKKEQVGTNETAKSGKTPAKTQNPPKTQKPVTAKPRPKPKPRQQVVFATEPLDVFPESAPKSSSRFESKQFNSDVVYKVEELPLSVRRNVPPIAFSGHVYSSIPTSRSVMLNDTKMREGQAVTTQLILKEITPNGAIFKFNGYLFSLVALQDWKFR